MTDSKFRFTAEPTLGPRERPSYGNNHSYYGRLSIWRRLKLRVRRLLGRKPAGAVYWEPTIVEDIDERQQP